MLFPTVIHQYIINAIVQYSTRRFNWLFNFLLLFIVLLRSIMTSYAPWIRKSNHASEMQVLLYLWKLLITLLKCMLYYDDDFYVVIIDTCDSCCCSDGDCDVHPWLNDFDYWIIKWLIYHTSPHILTLHLVIILFSPTFLLHYLYPLPSTSYLSPFTLYPSTLYPAILHTHIRCGWESSPPRVTLIH